jgi:hypothetical protein
VIQNVLVADGVFGVRALYGLNGNVAGVDFGLTP